MNCTPKSFVFNFWGAVQKIVFTIFSIWKGLCKKRSDNKNGMAELMTFVSMNFTRPISFYAQNGENLIF